MDVVEIQKWLEQIAKLDALIKNKNIAISRYMGIATKITASLDGMPHCGGVSDKVGNNAAKLAELSKEKDILERRKDYIIKTLEKLPADEYKVLYNEYVRYMKQKEICREMGYSRITVWRIKQKAFELLGELLKVETS